MRELFLISISGIYYGVWKDEILSVRDIHALHRIPLSPPRIAGILIDDNQTVTLGDLSVCIGGKPTQGSGQGSILLMAEDGKVAGFVVSGEIQTQSLPPEFIFPLPDYLKTQLFDSCVIHAGIPIPMINVSEIGSRVLKSDAGSFADTQHIPVVSSREISGMAKIRLFVVGGELYAASATGMDDKAVKPGPVTLLPLTPQYVQGITFHKGRILPVIDLSLRIKRQRGAAEPMMLIAKFAGDAFGFLVDSDGETLSANKVTIKPAPMIVQTSSLKNMVVRGGELIPLVGLIMALSPEPGADDEIPVWKRYTPGSGFPSVFAKHDADVVEFSLLGERTALPKEEVEEVISFKPCRALFDVPPVVIGVAEHNGEILPVVDLAMMFGRRSITTPAWRMMLVNNGDFRALVITETVFGERKLPLDIHRAVPIHLPHHLMYGCYPDANEVRLILNVEAISVHFEKSMIQKFLPALSHQMKKLSEQEEPAPEVASTAFPAPVQPESLAELEQQGVHQEADEVAQLLQQRTDESIDEEQEELADDPDLRLQSEPMVADLTSAATVITQEFLSDADEISADEALGQKSVTPDEAALEQPMETEPAAMDQQLLGEISMAEKIEYLAQKESAIAYSQAVPKFKQQAAEQDAEFVKWEEVETVAPADAHEPKKMDVSHAAESLARTRDSRSTAGELSPDATPEQENIPPVALISEAAIAAETHIATEKFPESPVPLSGDANQQPSLAGSMASGSVDKSKKSPDEVSKQPAQKVSSAESADSRTSIPALHTTSPKHSAPFRMSREVEMLAVQSGHEENAGSTWKRGIAFGAIAAVLIAVMFYYAGTFDKQGVDNYVKATESVMIEQDKEERAPVITKAERVEEKAGQARTQAEQSKARQTLVLSPRAKVEPSHDAEKTRAPLELDIPKNMPQIDIDEYVVQEGDTLWSISERFTGSPFNYPRIAGENRIADPDLIFPKQRIRLVK